MEASTLSVSESKCPGCFGGCLKPISGQEFLSLCRDCGLVFDNPRPSVTEIETYYSQESQYDGWLQQLDERNRLWGRRIRKMRRHRNSGSLLDVGTGIGQFLNQAQTEYAPIVGTEISPVAIEIAHRLYGLSILKGDIEAIELRQQFDNVTAFHVLEHVHQPSHFLERCYSVLRPGGVLFVAVPNELEMLASRTGKCPLKPISFSTAEIHLSHFTSKSIASLLRRCGFEVMNISLDPFWVVSSSKEYLQTVRYLGMGMLEHLTGVNLYPTIWAVARKPY